MDTWWRKSCLQCFFFFHQAPDSPFSPHTQSYDQRIVPSTLFQHTSAMKLNPAMTMVGCISEVYGDEKKPRVLSDMSAPMHTATHWCNIISDSKRMKQERRMLQESYVKRFDWSTDPQRKFLSSWIPFWFSVVSTISHSLLNYFRGVQPFMSDRPPSL